MQIETRHARNGETTIAWTVVGDARTDLLFIPGFISHVEHIGSSRGWPASPSASWASAAC
ncbi:MAG: hypothetical protein ACXWZZ_06965 [Solirubrobacteraceae bacterium]